MPASIHHRLWDRSHRFAVALHRLTRCLPDDERRSVGAELLRLASDIPILIAESARRKERGFRGSWFSEARGRAREVECLLLILSELPFLNPKTVRMLSRENRAILDALRGGGRQCGVPNDTVVTIAHEDVST